MAHTSLGGDSSWLLLLLLLLLLLTLDHVLRLCQTKDQLSSANETLRKEEFKILTLFLFLEGNRYFNMWKKFP